MPSVTVYKLQISNFLGYFNYDRVRICKNAGESTI